jgi:hypothetical protein
MQPTSYLCVLNARTLDCVKHRMDIDAIHWEKNTEETDLLHWSPARRDVKRDLDASNIGRVVYMWYADMYRVSRWALNIP